MSTLKVNTVQHNTSGFNNVVQFTDGAGTENGQLARAWVNFNGQGTVAIRADFNVNSVSDRGTGQYTLNYSNAMPDTNYSIIGSSNQFFNSNGFDTGFTHTASTTGIKSYNTSSTLTDYGHMFCAVSR